MTKIRGLYANGNSSNIRKHCIEQLAKELEQQINTSYQSGGFNVFN